MSGVAVGAAVMGGIEILKSVLAIAASPGGLAWVERTFKDKQPEIDKRIAEMKDWEKPKV